MEIELKAFEFERNEIRLNIEEIINTIESWVAITEADDVPLIAYREMIKK